MANPNLPALSFKQITCWNFLLLLIFMVLESVSPVPTAQAATPGQAYHRTPICADGNCAPNRATSGFHATRWRPWPGGEPSQNRPVPQVGIDVEKIQVPSREKELDMPLRPTGEGGAANTEPSPNDLPGGGIVLPPELRNMTPKKPVEESRPGNSNIPRGPLLSGLPPGPSIQPLMLGNKSEPPRPLSPVPPLQSAPSNEPPMLRIRPVGNSQSGLMPEMVPWNDQEKNPIIRQSARITGKQVQQTISLDETALPDANEGQRSTIRVQHISSSTPAALQVSAISQPMKEASANSSEWRSPVVNAPAILPNIEARPLPLNNKVESNSGSPAVASPLRGLSQGNPLRR